MMETTIHNVVSTTIITKDMVTSKWVNLLVLDSDGRKYEFTLFAHENKPIQLLLGEE